MPSEVFVFGSNLRGRHGAGAARDAAREYGAVEGVPEGPTGRAYAIPTRNFRFQTLPLEDIARRVTRFVEYAFAHPELIFRVTRIGCGLAGYKNWQIAPMFKGAPVNCGFDDQWGAFGLQPWSAAAAMETAGPEEADAGTRRGREGA